MNTKKRVSVTIVAIAVFAVLLFGMTPVIAQTPPAASQTPQQELKCTFISASGIGFSWEDKPCGELLANYIIALNTFFYRLAIVLAVLMITIGGFQWLAAMGNASKISGAKETIEQAVIGLALAFTAYIIFSQIDQSFVKLKSLDISPPDIKWDCGLSLTRLACESSGLNDGKQCHWECKYILEDPAICTFGTCKTGTRNYCNPGIQQSIDNKGITPNTKKECPYTPGEKLCLDTRQKIPPNWKCCQNTTDKVYMFAFGSCNQCPVPQGKSAPWIGSYWKELSLQDCVVTTFAPFGG